MGKKVIAVCSHCQYEAEEKQLDPHLRLDAHDIKLRYKTPLTLFIGLFLLGGAILMAILAGQRDKSQEKDWVASPQAKDIYELKTGKNEYVMMRINRVNVDSVYVSPSNYSADRIGTLDRKMNEADFFSSEAEYVMPRSALAELYAEGKIVDIHRK